MANSNQAYREALQESDPKAAFKLFSQAAQAGDPDGMFMVASLHQEGRGVQKSNELAARWYEKAADAGNARAHFNLGILLQEGLGVKKDLAESMRRYEAAAEEGLSKAAYNLAALHYAREPGGRQPGLALQWYARAARLGEPRGRDGVRMCLDAMRIDEVLGIGS